MTVALYQDLMEQLGQALNLTFTEDGLSNGMARIDYPDDMHINIRYEEKNDAPQILLLAELGNVAPGAYRERLFKAILIENYGEIPLDAIFSYSIPQDMMVAYKYFNIENIDVDKLQEELNKFTQKVQTWKESIQRSEIPASAKEAPSGPVGMFGL